MISFVSGDIFESDANVIAIPVNCVGVMGKGLALQFKQRYPWSFFVYKRACDEHQLDIGKLMLVRAIAETDYDRRFLMFPTKYDWRKKSELWMISDGLDKFVDTYLQHDIRSIAFPRLGCGCGGLDWSEVKQLMFEKLSGCDCEIYIYE